MEQITITLEQHAATSMKLLHDQFEVIIDRPEAKGGGGAGLMGGQYLLTGIAGCFCSTFFAAAQARNVTVEGLKVQVIATVSEELPKRFTDVKLEVTYESCSDPDAFGKLLKMSEQGCISVNTVKNAMTFSAEAV